MGSVTGTLEISRPNINDVRQKATNAKSFLIKEGRIETALPSGGSADSMIYPLMSTVKRSPESCMWRLVWRFMHPSSFPGTDRASELVGIKQVLSEGSTTASHWVRTRLTRSSGSGPGTSPVIPTCNCREPDTCDTNAQPSEAGPYHGRRRRSERASKEVRRHINGVDSTTRLWL